MRNGEENKMQVHIWNTHARNNKIKITPCVAPPCVAPLEIGRLMRSGVTSCSFCWFAEVSSPLAPMYTSSASSRTIQGSYSDLSSALSSSQLSSSSAASKKNGFPTLRCLFRRFPDSSLVAPLEIGRLMRSVVISCSFCWFAESIQHEYFELKKNYLYARTLVSRF
jgi:hypothetical protein